MTPPFTVLDEATGKILQTDAEGNIVESGGVEWKGLDIDPGQTMSMWKGGADGAPQERESPGLYRKLVVGGPTGPTGPSPTGPTGPIPTGPTGPNPEPPMAYPGPLPPVPNTPPRQPMNASWAGSFNVVNSYADLINRWQNAEDNGYVLQVAPNQRIIADQPRYIWTRDTGLSEKGIAGNGLKIIGGFDSGAQSVCRVEAVEVQSYFHRIGGIFWTSYNEASGAQGNFRSALAINANRDTCPNGIYLFRYPDLTFSVCNIGLELQDYIFEGHIDNLTDHANGLCAVLLRQNVSHSSAVLSNVYFHAPDIRGGKGGVVMRGSGRDAQHPDGDAPASVIFTDASFVSIDNFGIDAPAGIKSSRNIACENVGELSEGIALSIGPYVSFGMSLTDSVGSNTGNQPFLCRYLGPPNLIKHSGNWSHLGPAVFTPDSTVQEPQ